jgi:NADPH2:quinone reductase
VKAVIVERFGGPEVMEYRDVPTPEVGPGDVLIEVHAVTVNRTLDIHVRENGDGRNPILPLVLGVDPVGVVVEIGANVSTSKLGMRVAIAGAIGCGRCASCLQGRAADCVTPVHLGIHRWGGYADYVKIPAVNTVDLPDNLGFPELAVIFRHFPTAFHLLDCKARVAAGDIVLIMGAAGGLGNAGIQVANYRGATVIAAAGSDAGVALARELGADFGINYRSEDLAARVREITNERGVDIVFENIGAPDLWPAAFNSLAGGGRLVTAGAHGGGTVTLDVKRLYRNKLQVIGGAGSDPKDVAATVEGAASGRFRAAIDRILTLNDVAEAHRLVNERLVTGKVVLVPERVAASASR